MGRTIQLHIQLHYIDGPGFILELLYLPQMWSMGQIQSAAYFCSYIRIQTYSSKDILFIAAFILVGTGTMFPSKSKIFAI